MQPWADLDQPRRMTGSSSDPGSWACGRYGTCVRGGTTTSSSDACGSRSGSTRCTGGTIPRYRPAPSGASGSGSKTTCPTPTKFHGRTAYDTYCGSGAKTDQN